MLLPLPGICLSTCRIPYLAFEPAASDASACPESRPLGTEPHFSFSGTSSPSTAVSARSIGTAEPSLLVPGWLLIGSDYFLGLRLNVYGSRDA